MKESTRDETQVRSEGADAPWDLSKILSELNEYLKSCHPQGEDAPKKRQTPFPNLAGFCRRLGCGIPTLEGLRLAHPNIYERICTVLEDEALNAEISPTVLVAYLKKRLGYAEKEEAASSADCGQMRLVFEHDILEDGT